MHVTSSEKLDTTNNGRVDCDTLLPQANQAPTRQKHTNTMEQCWQKNKSTKTDTLCQSLLKCTTLDLLLLQWNK